MAVKPGYVQVSYTYSRVLGPRSVHGSVTLAFSPASAFLFRDEVMWPREIGNYSKAVEACVREVLGSRNALAHEVILKSATFDPVNSCEAGFRTAARVATESAFEV